MRRALTVRLAAAPEVKNFDSKKGDGKTFTVATFTGYEADPTSAKGEKGVSWASVPRHFKVFSTNKDAFGAIASMQKGETLSATARIELREGSAKDENGKGKVYETYVVEKVVDHEVVKQAENLFVAFAKGRVEALDIGVPANYPEPGKEGEQGAQVDVEQAIEEDFEFVQDFDEEFEMGE